MIFSKQPSCNLWPKVSLAVPCQHPSIHMFTPVKTVLKMRDYGYP